MKNKYLYAICFMLIAQFINAQIEVSWDAPEFSKEIYRDYTPPPNNYRDMASVDIIVNYKTFYVTNDDGDTLEVYQWPEEAITAMEYAVSIWESILISDVPIEINAAYRPLGGAGQASVAAHHFSDYYNWNNAVEHTWYPSALANSLAGEDLFWDIDIYLSMGAADEWYFGTDGNCPENKYDFVHVALHEICHGLGYLSTHRSPNQISTYGYTANGQRRPNIFDRFLKNENGFMVDIHPDSTDELHEFLTSDDYWSGISTPTAKMKTNYELAVVGALHHLDFWLFSPHENDDPDFLINSLMNPQIFYGESNHNPGPLNIGILKDIGWEVDYSSPPTMLEFNMDYNGPVGSPCASVVLEFEANLSDEYIINYYKIGSKDDTVQITVENDIFDIQIDDLKVDENYAFWFDAVNEYTTATSPVIVRGACKSPIVVYPNPTVESVKVAYEDNMKVIENVEVRKTDNPNIGKTKQGDGVSNEISVNIDDLPVGTYTVIVTNADGSTSTKTIVVY